MSFFYLTPVKGDMPIDLLETIVNKRLEFLKTLYKSENIVYNEYLVDGSVYDTVGHFMLCIIAILENNIEFTQFVVKAEITLFKLRLEALVAYDLRYFAKRLLRKIRKIEINLLWLEPLKILCEHLLLKQVVHHISSTCSDNCSMHSLQVKFKHCLKFISKRLVELRDGFACIPCSKWKSYLILLFETNLKKRLTNTDLEILKHDPRITDLLNKVRRQVTSLDNTHNNNIIKSQEIDGTSKFFPPCMLNLHLHLRRKHRLSHDQRFYYSLFLKDIGMPINESVHFWRSEYQQSPNGKHNCCHNWEKDERRFMYGIRHLYGLEGGRKNYSSKTCQHIQGCDTSCSEGGCPFKSFDDEAMLKVLNIKETDILFTQIKSLQIRKQYTSACMLYLQNRFVKSGYDCDISFNLSPVKYFILASKSQIL